MEADPNQIERAPSNEASKTIDPVKNPIKTVTKDPTPQSLESDVLPLGLVSFRICQVLVPVTLCSLYVIVLIRLLETRYDDGTNIMTPIWEKLGLGATKESKFSEILLNNLLIVGMFVLLIILITLIILFVFYLEWHRCLNYYFYLPSLIIIGVLTPAYFKEVLVAFNVGLDIITLLIMTWNLVALGMISIFNIYAKAPLYVQQFYLIHNSAVVAVLIINALPSWAPWILLLALIGWDLFAVLAPCGPLNLIIDMAERDGMVEMPGLVYTTDAMYLSEAAHRKQLANVTVKRSSKESVRDAEAEAALAMKTATKGEATEPAETVASRTKLEPANKPTSAKQLEIEKPGRKVTGSGELGRGWYERGLNIGLGDFIFYSLLIGLTCKGRDKEDFYTTLATLNAVQVGLGVTLVLLAINKRALPALPICIAMGMIIALISAVFAARLANRLATEQVFI